MCRFFKQFRSLFYLFLCLFAVYLCSTFIKIILAVLRKSLKLIFYLHIVLYILLFSLLYNFAISSKYIMTI